MTPVSAMACSGKNVGAIIAGAQTYGRINFLFVAMLLGIGLICNLRRVLRSPALMGLGALFVTHPSMFVSAAKGDCGGMLIDLSTAYSFLAVALIGWQASGVLRERAKATAM
jgi:hypothetical protein